MLENQSLHHTVSNSTKTNLYSTSIHIFTKILFHILYSYIHFEYKSAAVWVSSPLMSVVASRVNRMRFTPTKDQNLLVALFSQTRVFSAFQAKERLYLHALFRILWYTFVVYLLLNCVKVFNTVLFWDEIQNINLD